MPVYHRHFSGQVEFPWLADFAKSLAKQKGYLFEVEGSESDPEAGFTITLPNEEYIISVERNTYGDELFAEELQEFLDELEEALPSKNAIQLSSEMRLIKTIHAIQISTKHWMQSANCAFTLLGELNRKSGGYYHIEEIGFFDHRSRVLTVDFEPGDARSILKAAKWKGNRWRTTWVFTKFAWSLRQFTGR